MTTKSNPPEPDSAPTWIRVFRGVAALLGLGACGTYLTLGPANPIPALLLILAFVPAIIVIVVEVVPSDEEAGL